MEPKLGFSLGGCLSPVVYCIRFGLWLQMLLCFVPVLNYAMILVMAFKGRSMVWNKGAYTDATQFNEDQAKWDKILCVVFLITLAPLAYASYSIISMFL